MTDTSHTCATTSPAADPAADAGDASMVTDGRLTHPHSVAIPPAVAAAIDGVRMWQGKDLVVAPCFGGLSNENWKVTDDTGTYFIKVPGVGAGSVNRSQGDQGTTRASDLGIGAKVYEFDPDTGVEVTEFLDGYETCTTTSLRTPEQCRQAIGLYRTLHGSAPFDTTNTLFDQIDEHVEQIRKLGIRMPDWCEELVDDYQDVKARFMASGLDLVPCHNDPMPGNFMTKDGHMKIIDFEYCGNNEASCELGVFLSEMFIDEEDMLPLIEEYAGRVTPQFLARVQASRVIGDVKWGMWGIITSVVRDVRFDYWKYGIWKLMRAYTYRAHLDWHTVKETISRK
ncbi:MAG: phosphotransferase [Bifidobacteriaceae bacterium]|nr:phosphotransferase [Bifidobacteriaceae bacterium]